MPSRAAFLPPRKSPLVMSLVNAALPLMCRTYAGGLEVEISEEDLSRLRGLKKQRLLLLPNHPTHFDPMVLMEVSKRIEGNLYFVAAREVFDRGRGTHGWLFQRCGVYSLIRGAVDRESFAMTQKILAAPAEWLVIFPEGEASLENDTVLPFEAGVLSLAMRVQEKLGETGEALHTAVLAMKTLYEPGVEQVMATSLRALEVSVGLAPGGEFEGWEPLRKRIEAVGDALLKAVERTYLLNPKAGATLEERMGTIKDRLLTKMEAFLDLKPAGNATVLDRVRAVKNRMDRVVQAYSEGETVPPYEGLLLEIRRQTFGEFHRDLGRLVNFLTLRGGYLQQATPERFAEVIIRLEKEILGKPRLLYPRTVHVKLGKVRDLRESLEAFRSDKRKCCGALTESLEGEMVGLLEGMGRRG